ncbi:MAG: DUF5666 domain-containing protein [Burkholderiaceae bacterium]|nr:DUF5666 domain-containing protein [Burkholderiaceae bacterium]
MNTPNLPHVALLRSWLAALLLALTACGGVETGGTGTGAYVQGPISGFGSIIVAGVRFDDLGAAIEDPDDVVRRREDLRLGMLVEVESGPIGDDGSGGRAATAMRVRLASELLGPVTLVDPTNARLTVLGQPVRLTPATVVDGVAGGAASLQVGDVVEIFGFFAQADGYVATRVERRGTAPASYRVRGPVRDIDRIASTLRIGLQGFDLATVGVPAGLVPDQFVRLRLLPSQQGDGRWPVTRITVETRSAGDRDEAEVEGLIGAFTGADQFSVNGVRVDAVGATIGDRAGLREGVRVKVRGRSQAGVLVAATVDIRSDDDAFSEGVDLRDVVGNVDAAAQTFTLRGITVFYGTQPPPRFDNGTTATDLLRVPAPRVRVRGTLSADRTRVIATRIEFVSN